MLEVVADQLLGGVTLACQVLEKDLPLYKFHHEIHVAVIVVGFEILYYVWVVQLVKRGHFARNEV